MNEHLLGNLSKPKRPNSIPSDSQWLGGVGAGSWFYLFRHHEMEPGKYGLKRFTKEGLIECDLIFTLTTDIEFDIEEDYEFTYISHCQQCHIVQNGKLLFFRNQDS